MTPGEMIDREDDLKDELARSIVKLMFLMAKNQALIQCEEFAGRIPAPDLRLSEDELKNTLFATVRRLL